MIKYKPITNYMYFIIKALFATFGKRIEEFVFCPYTCIFCFFFGFFSCFLEYFVRLLDRMHRLTIHCEFGPFHKIRLHSIWLSHSILVFAEVQIRLLNPEKYHQFSNFSKKTQDSP